MNLKVYRLDKFKVPAAARAEFLERVRVTHQLLRNLPGFLEDVVLEQTGGPGVYNFVTVVVWRDAEAVESAKSVVAENYRETGFDPRAMFDRLGIEADMATYAEVVAARMETAKS